MGNGERLDPLLTQRNLLVGLCSLGSPNTDQPTLIRVVGSARLRVDDDLLITVDNPDRTAQLAYGFVKLTGYQMVDGVLHAVVEAPEVTDRRRRNTLDTSGTDLLARVAAAGGTVLLSSKPYLRAATKSYFGPRWGGRSVPQDRRVSRDVPLDVLLAGA